jgi:hypothetical protein
MDPLSIALHFFYWFTDPQTDTVYLVHDILSGENVIIKLEPMGGKDHTLHHEYHVYTKLSGGTGIPCVCWFGMEDGFYAMVIEYIGPSLDNLFVCCHFKFAVKTIMLLAR